MADAFKLWREEWIAALPEPLQKAVNKRPDPHITLMYGCNGSKDACMEGVRALTESKEEQTIGLSDEVFVSPTHPVVFVPLCRCETILQWFTELFENETVNPLGSKSPMTLNTELATRTNPDATNPYGYVPHMTVAWFDKEQQAELLNLTKTDHRFVRATGVPSFSLTSDNIEWETLQEA